MSLFYPWRSPLQWSHIDSLNVQRYSDPTFLNGLRDSGRAETHESRRRPTKSFNDAVNVAHHLGERAMTGEVTHIGDVQDSDGGDIQWPHWSPAPE